LPRASSCQHSCQRSCTAPASPCPIPLACGAQTRGTWAPGRQQRHQHTLQYWPRRHRHPHRAPHHMRCPHHPHCPRLLTLAPHCGCCCCPASKQARSGCHAPCRVQRPHDTRQWGRHRRRQQRRRRQQQQLLSQRRPDPAQPTASRWHRAAWPGPCGGCLSWRLAQRPPGWRSAWGRAPQLRRQQHHQRLRQQQLRWRLPRPAAVPARPAAAPPWASGALAGVAAG
jgi:hypothetical protein